MKELPTSIIETAYQAPNGEYAWRRSDIDEAVNGIAQSGQAMLGGEVWVVIDGRFMQLIPSAKNEPPGVWSWDTTARKQSESWAEYSSRTATETIITIANMKVEEDIRSDLRDHVYFNVTYVDENDI